MITRKEFTEGNFKKRANLDRKKHPVYLFLKKNKGNAFRTVEISKGTKLKEDTVRGVLSKLIKDKLVSHKSPYFMGRR